MSRIYAHLVLRPSRSFREPMRLLDTKTGQFIEKDPEDRMTVYAILSHTWDEKGEQTYQELRIIQQRHLPSPQTPQSGLPDGLEEDTPPLAEQEHTWSSPSMPAFQVPEDHTSVTTPVIPSSERSNSWLARRIAPLRRFFHRRPRSAHASSQLPSDPPSTTSHPQTELGRLTQSEVEALLCAVSERYNLATPIPPPVSSDPSATSPLNLQHMPPLNPIWSDPDLSPKIFHACRVARENGYHYIWIDSCCIDKSSSSELSEAINSMYKWYGLAAVCYAYLADVPLGEGHQIEGSAFRKSRWFQRGWTLQELIAPINVEFLSDDWTTIGSKHGLVELVGRVTKINHEALLHLVPLDSFSVAQRLSWAADRKTTREEDQAYSLLGMFDINMPTLYGEGRRAFRRLQEQIMQHIPDRSIFAWADVYLGSHLFHHDLTDTPETFHVETDRYNNPGSRNLFAPSPDKFQSCEGIRTPHDSTIQLPSSQLHEIEYTFTPHGIRMQFPMIHLNRDLLLHAMPQAKDVELIGPHENDQWYLAILGCEHVELPGHLLGRVCYIPSSKSSVEFVYTGFIRVNSQGKSLCRPPDLIPLSPATIEYCRANTELKTVYIPHPNRADLLSSHGRQPYTAIKLVLLRETRDVLYSQGYLANLYHPELAHPTTHWLTLSKDEKTITVEFQHTLENGGREFTINAKVQMSGPCVQPDSALDSDQVDVRTVSWSDSTIGGWETELGHKSVRLSAAGGRMLVVDLGLDFAGAGIYFLHVNVLSDALLASSAVGPPVDHEEEMEITEKVPASGGINIGGAAWEDPREAYGSEMASAEGRDAAATSYNTKGVDGDGGLA